MAESTVAPDEILALMEAPGSAGVYVLGCIERRVTVHSQQIRALNLVYALQASGKLSRGDRLAIVGGGIAGLTVAAAAATRGFDVHVYEKRSELVPLLRGCRSRWVHPHVADWATPRLGAAHALQTNANLPILNWSAESAGDVVSQLVSEWSALALKHRVSAERRKIEVTEAMLDRTAGGWHIADTEYRAVVIAVGFGLERMPPGYTIEQFSYWRDDATHQLTLSTSTQKRTVLVVGRGDGGLTDVFRSCIRDFDHRRLIDDFLGIPVLASVVPSLVEIENTALGLTGDYVDRHLESAYRALETPEFDVVLNARLRHDVSVTLADPGATPFSLGAAIYNRFLASRLLKLGRFEYISERVTFFGPPTSPINVRLESGRELTFDLVLPRIGPESALKLSFPAIASRLEARRTAASVDEPTRIPQWTDLFAQELATAQVDGAATAATVTTGSSQRVATRLSFWSLETPVRHDGRWRYHLGQLYVLEQLSAQMNGGDEATQIICDPSTILNSRRRPNAEAEATQIRGFLRAVLSDYSAWPVLLSEVIFRVQNVDEPAFKDSRARFRRGMDRLEELVASQKASAEMKEQAAVFREPLKPNGLIPPALRAAVTALRREVGALTPKHSLAVLHLFLHQPAWFDAANLASTGALLAHYGSALGADDVVVMEASRNAYVWLALEAMFLGWVKDQPNVGWPRLEFLDNIPDLTGRSFMRRNDSESCLFIDSTDAEVLESLRGADPQARARILKLFFGDGDHADGETRLLALVQKYRRRLPAINLQVRL